MKLSWAPEHMHVVRESDTNGGGPDREGRANGLNEPDEEET